ncbi:aldehyde dehydrogenase [Nocardioides carbamazepini]|uniref:aldehyde dehydrogenase n=1 Tax=Nocardioides carbamazepini TaxID=2854259 RepID=UPI00214A86E0|nr:aldehyde dehydrogenase [Nocardioides carbamazepini]MCR1781325.1 aldehyde dehydrogenase [Nocardioides carbamazepini]
MTALPAAPLPQRRAHEGGPLPRYEHFVAGSWMPPGGGRYLESTDPTSAQPWYEFARGDEDDARLAVGAAYEAFHDSSWRDLPQSRRSSLLRRLAGLVHEHVEDLALTETLDNGKLLSEMRGQLASLPAHLHYYAGLAEQLCGETVPGPHPAILNYTLREPLGVVVAITPWNSPLLLTTSKIGPALAAGNTVVVKPSEHTSASVLRLAPLFEEAGFPPGVFNVVTGLGREVGQALVEDSRVAKVSFTGSTHTGSELAASCGARFVRTTLELGGKSPHLVFPGADLDQAAVGIVAGVFAAAGQSCVAGSRVLVPRSLHDELAERVVERARSIRIGDPLEPATQLGQLATAQQLARVEEYVALGVAEGARVLTGGDRRSIAGLAGYFMEPTVFVGGDNRMRLCQEEIFGPVVTFISVDSEDEAIDLANHTRYGLAAGVWTADLSRAHRVAARLDAGTVWINTYRCTSPMSPRSGFKDSGIGIEHSAHSMAEYTRLKSVWVETREGFADDPFVLRT